METLALRMNIHIYDQAITDDLMDLLLAADPDQSTVIAYLEGAQVLVCRSAGENLAIAVLTQLDDMAELKNISVAAEHQGRGIAKRLIAECKALAQRNGARIIEVGTGNSSLSQLALYQKCGFRMHRIERGFFESYPTPIYENGIRCIDMVRLRAELDPQD